MLKQPKNFIMNPLELHLKNLDAGLFSKLEETKAEITLMLGKYSSNFPEYTDHSISHTLEVFTIASELLLDEEISALNADETYILSMACLLHDIGMCVPPAKIKEISESKEILAYKESHPNLSTEEFIRDIHQQLSHKFILHEWELLKIPTYKYATAIGLVAEGHRKVDLGNFETFNPEYFVKNGRKFVCLPYLAAILRIADELDVTNSRTPKILTKYYMPDNDISIREWSKHIATSQRNYKDNSVLYEVDCTDRNIYAALQDQFEKIQNVINYCQKVIRAIPFNNGKHYSLNLAVVKVKYSFIGFNPKGIRFSFDVQNVVTAFIGEDLYKDKLTSLREAIQNSIDSCRYKNKVLKENYTPFIKIIINDELISVEDNGAGMDEFIIENFFGRLASSFYEQEKVKSQFEAIGQFGVGVFSYFLMSEYIDIETKTINGSALKFRFDKDPKSYFHFYDKNERTTPGTTITMHLKKELKGKLTDGQLEKYIRKIFRHIEIPIQVNSLGIESIIEFQSFEINANSEINERLKLQHRKIGSELKLLAVSIDNEDVQGTCALIVNKNYLKTFLPSTKYFDYDLFLGIKRHVSTSQISLSQKGVFVNDYPSYFLNLLIGDINLKKKIKINIDRNEFTNTSLVYEIIQKFEIKILNKIFVSLEKKYQKKDDPLIVTNNFLANYSSRFTNDYFSAELIFILENFLYLKVYADGIISVVKISQLKNKYKKIILVSDEEDNVSIYEHFRIPIVSASGYSYSGVFDNVYKILTILTKYNASICHFNNFGYQLLQLSAVDKEFIENKNKIDRLRGYSSHELSKMDSNKIWASIWMNKKEFPHSFDNFSINYNHRFIKFIIKNYSTIQAQVEYSKIVKSGFDLIHEICGRYSKKDKSSIDNLNMLIMPLNNIEKLKKFSLDDF